MLVVKLGGAAGIDFQPLVADVASLIHSGEKVVLVHGGSAAADELSHKLGQPPQHFLSPSGVKSRYTDKKTLEIMLMACAGQLNKLLIAALQTQGVNAVGLTGLDGQLITAKRKKAVRAQKDGRVIVIRDDYSGQIEHINSGLIQLLLQAGYVPVISSFALSEAGEALNVDADRVAAQVAVAIKADALVLLTNVPGLLQNPADHSTLIDRIAESALASYEDVAQGKMKKKLLAAKEAVAGGISQVIIADARKKLPVSKALAQEGTVITP